MSQRLIPRASLSLSLAIGLSLSFPLLADDHVWLRNGPPAARFEARPVSPGANHVWIDGHWSWQGDQHVWVPGSYQVAPPNAVWQKPRWENKGGLWQYTPGRWLWAGWGTAGASPLLAGAFKCTFNSDCVSPLVCAAGVCRPECKDSRDCLAGSCAKETVYQYEFQGTQYSEKVRSCVPPPATIVGRVELQPGIPAKGCLVTLAALGGSVKCSASGDFEMQRMLSSGAVVLTVTVFGQPPRSVPVAVNAGQYNNAGVISFAAQTQASASVAPATNGHASKPAPAKRNRDTK